jgi:hypothetical protein
MSEAFLQTLPRLRLLPWRARLLPSPALGDWHRSADWPKEAAAEAGEEREERKNPLLPCQLFGSSRRSSADWFADG